MSVRHSFLCRYFLGIYYCYVSGLKSGLKEFMEFIPLGRAYLSVVVDEDYVHRVESSGSHIADYCPVDGYIAYLWEEYF